jgi:DNA-binding IscR family transcriptional regulator
MRSAKLVAGIEGIAGGFVLARPAEQIRVLEVLDAIDPGRKLFSCGEIRRNCALFGKEPPSWATEGSCRIDLFMREAERTLRMFLASKTLADLVCELRCKAPHEFVVESTSWFRQRMADRTPRRGRAIKPT